MATTIIPAASGTYLIWMQDDDHEREHVLREVVIAWRIDDADNAEPICVSSLPQEWAVQHSCGYVEIPEEATFTTIAEYIDFRRDKTRPK